MEILFSPSFEDLPFFVSINITPAAPLVPYIAKALASFRTSIDRISFTLIFWRLKSVPAMNPSITKRGSLLPWIELRPLILIVGVASGLPFGEVISSPAALPWRRPLTLEAGWFARSEPFTWAIEETSSFFKDVP